MSIKINDTSYQVNIEKAILSAVLMDFSVLDEITSLTPEMFFLPAHGEIFRVILELVKEDLPIDEEFIFKKLDTQKAGENHLIEILTANAITNVQAYVNELIENYKRRTILSILNQGRVGHQEGLSSDDLLAKLNRSLEDVEINSSGAEIKTVNEWEEYYEGQPPLKKFRTGLMVVDAQTSLEGGIEAGQFVFISGKKETGKTYFATTIMENLAAGVEYMENGVQKFQDPVKCGFFSMEFGTRAYIQKLHQKYPHVDNKRRMAIAQNVFVEHRVSDVAEIEKKIKKMVKKGVEYIFIDSQLRVGNASMNDATKAEKLADTFSRIGLMCQRYEIVIAIVVQTSKADHDSEEISVKGCIDADHECGVWFHFTKQKDSETRTILIAKNKQNFKRRKVDVRFNPIKHDFKIIHEHDLDKGHKKDDEEYEEAGSSQPVVTTFDYNGSDDISADIPDVLL